MLFKELEFVTRKRYDDRKRTKATDERKDQVGIALMEFALNHKRAEEVDGSGDVVKIPGGGVLDRKGLRGLSLQRRRKGWNYFGSR